MTEITYTILDKSLSVRVAAMLKVCFPDMLPIDQYSSEELDEMAEVFPEGTIVALDEDRVVGMGTGVFLDLDFDDLPPTENELLDDEDGEMRHEVDGAFYYGSDFAVHPDYRRMGIGRNIYQRRKAVVTRNNRKGFAAAAVLPGYEAHKATIGIHTYVEGVIAGDYYDPTLSMQLRNGFEVVGVKQDFFTYPRSDNWCALIVWWNPEYRKTEG